ncbi:MAG: response regulator [Sutterellaceae bacterium]|nr:response regulator [Burkholderiaceae bacterium]MCX7901406.1 response regulator [Burkholderiaceae bacterium]MDW8429985.1 response regulator [Sutterellaceae bacterium]
MSEAKPQILVVDDDRLVLATVSAGLKQADFDVLEADNGDDAILLARKHRPALAILDMRMQGKSGMDVARYLAANTHTGFMFLSAFGDADIIEEATKLGALGYLVKPIDVKQIVPAVRAALARLRQQPAVPRPLPPRASTSAPPPPPAREQYVAIGILMERLRLDYDRAAEALQAQARAEGRAVDELAASMVEAANRLNSVPR